MRCLGIVEEKCNAKDSPKGVLAYIPPGISSPSWVPAQKPRHLAEAHNLLGGLDGEDIWLDAD